MWVNTQAAVSWLFSNMTEKLLTGALKLPIAPDNFIFMGKLEEKSVKALKTNPPLMADLEGVWREGGGDPGVARTACTTKQFHFHGEIS